MSYYENSIDCLNYLTNLYEILKEEKNLLILNSYIIFKALSHQTIREDKEYVLKIVDQFYKEGLSKQDGKVLDPEDLNINMRN